LDGAPLGMLLSAQARLTPDAPALTVGARMMSFRELEANCNRRARFLADRHGVANGDRVVIALPNSVEFVETVYAIWKLGGVPCPISWRLSEREYTDLIDLIAPKLVVGESAPSATGCAFSDGAQPVPATYPTTELPSAVVVPGKIMNSGGSTGRPKLIVDPEPCAWGPDKEGRRRPPRNVFLNPGPLYHSAPFAYTTMSIAAGSHAICLERFDAQLWLDAVECHRPALVYMVPTMMSRVAKLRGGRTRSADLSSIETLIHMAAPCPQDVKRWWIDRLGPQKVFEVYGGTERIGATAIDGTEWLAHPGSVGRAAPGEEIVITGPDGNPLPHGEVGEIYFRRSVPPGSGYAYIGSDDRVVGDMDSFGDMGWLDSEGWLYIADRRTDMIVVGGTNVFPAEIEAALEMLPGAVCAAVIGLPDEDMGNRLHAIVELAVEVSLPEDGMAFLAPAMAGLSSIKRPRSVEFTRERLRDDAGKMRRARLRQDRVDGARGQ